MEGEIQVESVASKVNKMRRPPTYIHTSSLAYIAN